MIMMKHIVERHTQMEKRSGRRLSDNFDQDGRRFLYLGSP